MNNDMFWDIMTMVGLCLLLVLVLTLYNHSHNAAYEDCVYDTNIIKGFEINSTCSESNALTSKYWECYEIDRTALQNYCAKTYGEEWNYPWE